MILSVPAKLVAVPFIATVSIPHLGLVLLTLAVIDGGTVLTVTCNSFCVTSPAASVALILMLCRPSDSVPVVNDQFANESDVEAVDTDPESTFHDTDVTDVSSDDVPVTGIVVELVVVWLAGDVIDNV